MYIKVLLFLVIDAKLSVFDMYYNYAHLFTLPSSHLYSGSL